MSDWFVDMTKKVKVDPLVIDSGVRLFLYAHKSCDPGVIQIYPINSVQGMWLFCAFLLVFKLIVDGQPLQLERLLCFRAKHFQDFIHQWPHMELHLLETVEYKLHDFIYRVQLFDTHCV
jgi:hypothetical protein